MSTLNIYVSPAGERGLVLVDTLGTHGLETSKLLPIPHLNAVAAARGRSVLFQSMVNVLQSRCGSFDDALRTVDALFRQTAAEVNAADKPVWKMMRACAISLYEGEDEGADEFVLVGWSVEHQGVRGISLTAKIGRDDVSVSEDVWIRVAPSNAKVMEVLEKGVPLTDRLMLSLVRAQLLDLAESYPAAAAHALPGFGGRLLVAEVTRGQVTVRDLGPL